ncbi:MAG TPA: N-acetylmannosamine-6-phosphate 2-epimerase [Devosia sp.]|nr:N-acetylmannosamine-6-phosphate 2-epimerase [Devosia sp.]
MTFLVETIFDRLHGQLVVSCQAVADSPLAPTPHIVALAQAAVLGGAKGVRIEGIANVRAVRAAVDVPIIGIVKARHPGFEAFITTQVAEVDALADAGADIIAFDATDRARPVPVPDLVAAIVQRGRAAMADISTIAEARSAMAAGAHVAGTTLAGYTNYSTTLTGPDFALMAELASAGIRFVAEGRIWEPAEAARTISIGAEFVVVGSAITRPDDITRRYADAVAAVARPYLGETA